MIYARPEHGRTRAIGYEIRGDGPAVLLLHPFPFDRRVWDHARGQLDDFRTIAMDFRGFGESELGEPGFSVDDLADDAIALLDHLGVISAAIVGGSMGGYVALSLCTRHPARASALVLVDSRAAADGAEARANRQAAIAEIRAHGPGAYLDGVAVRACGRTTPAPIRERIQAAALASSKDFPRALPMMLEALRDRPDRTAALPALRLPTMIAVGDEDTVTPPDEAQAMRHAIPGADFAMLPAAGHLPMMEIPGPFSLILRGFLERALLPE